ncbi:PYROPHOSPHATE--FRUCTOSE 6-PHOSPHATE 1-PHOSPHOTRANSFERASE, partial [Salix viminalis]
VAAKKLTLKNVKDYIVNVICKRSDLGYNYGVIIIPEGLIDFIPEVAKIETEKMLIQMVETELEKRKQEGSYKSQQSHFFG